MKTNYHTHHGVCGHAFGSAEEYVVEALKKGVKILGFSDHSPAIREGDKGHRMDPEDLMYYIEDIDNAKQKYKDQIEIHIGLEIEYIEDNEKYYSDLRKSVSYFVLGQHFVNLTKQKEDIFLTYDFYDPIHIYKYLDSVKKALKELPITILAHPDLYLFNYKTWDHHAEKVAREICELCKETNTYIEYNANGYRGEKVNIGIKHIYRYPRKEFFEVVKEYGLKVVVSSDAHHPSLVYDETMEQAVEDARKMGLNVVDQIVFKKMK